MKQLHDCSRFMVVGDKKNEIVFCRHFSFELLTQQTLVRLQLGNDMSGYLRETDNVMLSMQIPDFGF